MLSAGYNQLSGAIQLGGAFSDDAVAIISLAVCTVVVAIAYALK